jgi:hypothetical protein
MFFNIGRIQNNNFPVHVKHNDLHIDLDTGWTITEKQISKGLSENQCTIKLLSSGIEIDTSIKRSFPVYYDCDNISNLFNYEMQYATNDGICLLNDSVKFLKNSYSTKFRNLNLTNNEVFDYLYHYLDDKIKNFETDLPIKLFPTGGVDISLLISFIIKHKKRYELLTYEHKDMDYFVCYNRADIGNNWAYRDIHHWTNPSILLSGTHGDEMMLRLPQHAYMLGKINGENILDDLRSNSNLYHSHYYLRSKQQKSYKEADELNLNADQAKEFILGRNSFDYQHWHLGNTLTWAPLNDLEITNIMLNFDYDFLRTQFLDAGISKKLIARNNPQHLKLVSQAKNVNHFGHLCKLFEGIDTLS